MIMIKRGAVLEGATYPDCKYFKKDNNTIVMSNSNPDKATFLCRLLCPGEKSLRTLMVHSFACPEFILESPDCDVVEI